MDSRQRYKAFISYSHRDRKVAEWLHRTLETYRAPRALASGGDAVSSGTLRPIFRDRDELSAAGNLNEVIRDALDDSEAMIILCSSDSAASRWVDQEVAYFVASGGVDRVICVIAPEVDARTDLAEVLPPSLRGALPAGVEPLAVDLRRDADGKRLARLKIAARLLGVNLDRLVQRDARRRLRVMTAFTTAASLIALGMGAMTVETLRSRQIARQQRDETEALVAYMLGDLREQLEPLGKLEVLDGVGARVLAYYAKPRTDRLDDKALAQRAKAQTLLGTIREQRGDLAGAQAAFGQAAATTKALVDRDPRNGERIFDEAQNVFWLGYVEWRRGDVEAAERLFKRYEALALDLVKLDPNRAEWRVEVAYANNNLGTLLFEQGRPEEAVTAFRRALAVFDAEVARAPTKKNLTGAANSRAWVADALVRQGRPRDALAERETVSALLTRASAQAPDDKRLLARSLGADLALARLERDLGRKASSQARFDAAVRRLTDLAKLDPTNARWREYLIGAQIDAADRLAWSGEVVRGKAVQAAAVVALAKLRAGGDSKVWTPDLDGRMYRGSIALAQLSGDQVKARRLAEELLARLKTLESDHEGEADRSALKGYAQLALGDARGAIATLEPRRRALAPSGLDTLARAYREDDQQDRAAGIVLNLRQAGYANPAFLAFWGDAIPDGAVHREINP